MRHIKILGSVLIASLITTCAAQTNMTQKAPTLMLVSSKTFDKNPIGKVEFSKDGKLLLSASKFEQVRIVDTANFHPVGKYEIGGLLTNAQLLPDKKLFIANQSGLARVWNIEPAKILFETKFSISSRFAQISQNENEIAYGGNLYNRKSGKSLSKPYSHAVQTALEIYDDNRIMTSGFHDHRIVLRDFEGHILKRITQNDPISVAAVVSNQYLVAGTNTGRLLTWSLSNNGISDNPTSQADVGQSIYLLSTDKQSTIIAISSEHTAFVFSLNPLRELFKVKTSDMIRSLKVRNDWLALGEDNGQFLLWNIKTKKQVGFYKVDNDIINTIDINSAKSSGSQSVNIALGTDNGHLIMLKYYPK